jgi:hypothetical protein
VKLPWKTLIGLIAATGLIALGSGLVNNQGGPAAPRSWLGPLAPIAAQVQWIRAEEAILDGYPGRTLNLMESAIELDPSVAAGWISLADHLGLYLASAEAGESMGARVAWLASALEATRQGQEWVPHPEDLAFHRGILLVSHGGMLEPIHWGSRPGDLWLDAASAFDEAATLGHPDANSAANFARSAAAKTNNMAP